MTYLLPHTVREPGEQRSFITAGQTPPDITQRGRRGEGGSRRTAGERQGTNEGGEENSSDRLRANSKIAITCFL